MKVLGIESSCDETAAAIVEQNNQGELVLLSNVVASSIDLHTEFGGVVPEIAARSHIESITPVIEQAMKQANCTWSGIDGIAVTYGPGLGGSLLVGVLSARTLAIVKNKPIYGINHVLAHVYSAFLGSSTIDGYKFSRQKPQFPLLALIVSGGHTQLVLFKDVGNYKVLGRTHDDAIGEAFDKVAKILGLPYPGGPSISKLANSGDPDKYPLPKARLSDYFGFSFSGLKTAVLRTAQNAIGEDYNFPSHELSGRLNDTQKANLAASFQNIAAQTVVDKLELACKQFSPKSVVIAGGVAANQELRKQAQKRLSTPVIYPDIKLCTDNAAMIAATCLLTKNSPADDPFSLEINPSLSMVEN